MPRLFPLQNTISLELVMPYKALVSIEVVKATGVDQRCVLEAHSL